LTELVRGPNSMANATSGVVLFGNDLLSSRGAAVSGLGVHKAFNQPVNMASFFLIINNLSGKCRVAGTTVDGGTPVKRRVYLFAQPSMLLVRSTTTELPAGAYEFTELAAGEYVVMGFDPDGVQNAVAYSHVTSVV